MASHEPQTSHAGIRIKRTIGGKEIVFVGFIRGDDTGGYVTNEVMLDRVRAAGFVPLDDSGHLEAHKSEWADDPELAPFYVVTDERHPAGSGVRCFGRASRGRYWDSLASGFGRSYLVACRAA